MSETKMVLARITALRQRLEQGRALAQRTAAAATEVAPPWLAGTIHAEGEHDRLVDQAVAPVTGLPTAASPSVRQLTLRARRVLELGCGLLSQLRSLGGAFAPPYPEPAEPGTPASAYLFDFSDPLAHWYRETAAIADTALRMLPHFPDSATGQLHLCEGLEGILNVVGQRLQTLTAVVAQHRRETDLRNRLADLLSGVEQGQIHDLMPFRALADQVIEEAREGEPLRFQAGDATQPAQFVAAHSLTTARVLARVARADPALNGKLPDAILAALLHDVGMLRVPGEILSHPGPLSAAQRQQVESHCQVGARLLEPLAGEQHGLIEAAAGHHERQDGSGYPNRLRGGQIGSLTRLLAVCDCYASLCTPRPHRPAGETRTALADVLLLAEQGQLDQQHAELLLQLSFYPAGSAVELADGTVGVVVAGPASRRDPQALARPVVALLFDGDKQPLPLPRYLDLAQADSHSIIRALPLQERRELFGTRYPEWIS